MKTKYSTHLAAIFFGTLTGLFSMGSFVSPAGAAESLPLLYVHPVQYNASNYSRETNSINRFIQKSIVKMNKFEVVETAKNLDGAEMNHSESALGNAEKMQASLAILSEIKNKGPYSQLVITLWDVEKGIVVKDVSKYLSLTDENEWYLLVPDMVRKLVTNGEPVKSLNGYIWGGVIGVTTVAGVLVSVLANRQKENNSEKESIDVAVKW